MTTIIRVLDEEFSLEVAACDEKRLEDLAKALNERLAGFSGDVDGKRRLVLTALSLLDQVQTTSAALIRARGEIERLTDMVVEAKLEAEAARDPDTPERGRVGALRVAQGVA